MTPAREVGGDFYDFFLIDRDRLGLVIGDVSGKGIPAAIFMAVCRTLLKATAMQDISTGACLKYVNDVLTRQSDAAMFVTIFYGILHTDTGALEYCIGGHNPPYVLSSSRDLRILDEPSSVIVGAFENVPHRFLPADSRTQWGGTRAWQSVTITRSEPGSACACAAKW